MQNLKELKKGLKGSKVPCDIQNVLDLIARKRKDGEIITNGEKVDDVIQCLPIGKVEIADKFDPKCGMDLEEIMIKIPVKAGDSGAVKYETFDYMDSPEKIALILSRSEKKTAFESIKMRVLPMLSKAKLTLSKVI